ncbi:unnamed protein product [Lota lota]
MALSFPDTKSSLFVFSLRFADATFKSSQSYKITKVNRRRERVLLTSDDRKHYCVREGDAYRSRPNGGPAGTSPEFQELGTGERFQGNEPSP